MRRLVNVILCLGLLIGLPAVAQQPASRDESGAVPSAVAKYRPTFLLAVTVYLHRADGRWSASLEGDVNDSSTEKIEVKLSDASLRVMTDSRRERDGRCVTKQKDRSQYGYTECNSAFYSANMGSTAAATLIRGVLSLGILTVTDAATDNTIFTVSFNQEALNAAVAESRAIELARESVPLVEYREAFSRARSSRDLRRFIATYEGMYDPESLVAMAKEKLPVAIEHEETRVRQQAAAEARQLEMGRQQEIQRGADRKALGQFQARLRPGDRVKIKLTNNYIPYGYGMVIEVKPPLAYLQWENVTPALQWVRLENLLPPM